MAFPAFGLLDSLFISKMELSKKHVEKKTGLVKDDKDRKEKTKEIREV
jgi:hypothetical protein